MPLCLLSRGPQNLGLPNFGYCFWLSKAMIALFFDSVLLQSTSSTSQPRQQKSLCGQLPPALRIIDEHSITKAATPPCRLKDTLVVGTGRMPRRLFGVSKPHSLSVSGSLDHSVLSTKILSDDHLCLVCSSHSSASCPVCEQGFCSNHLYLCLDCDSQYCGSCLDDHRANGHWTDSDTNAELSHGWRETLVFVAFPVGKDGTVFALNHTQCSCSNQFANQSHSSVFWPTARNRPLSRISHHQTLASFTSLFARAMHAVRSCFASYAARARVMMFSQVEFLEVCL